MPAQKINTSRKVYKSNTSNPKPKHQLHQLSQQQKKESAQQLTSSTNKNNNLNKSNTKDSQKFSHFSTIKPAKFQSNSNTKNGIKNGQTHSNKTKQEIQKTQVATITTITHEPKSYIIDDNTALQRLDNFLVKQCKGVPKSLFYRLLRTGAIRVNGKKQKPDYRINIGDDINIPAITMTDNDEKQQQQRNMVLPMAMQKKQSEIQVLFEDECLLVVNKPAGLAVHGGSGINWGLIELLRHERPEHQFLELVHRIDRDTSGVLVLAKKRSSLVHLHEQIRSHQIDKRYLALVKGKFPTTPETLEYPLFKTTLANGERRVYVKNDGKEAKTKIHLEKMYTHQSLEQEQEIYFSLVHARIFTGRTHQIRVHCQHRGFPILGDEKYGDETLNQFLIQKNLLKGMALHAHRFTCTHPKTNEKMTFELPYPDTWKKLITSAN
jgi:23S rRNA pseudouridine955/2504/2580 synthase